MTGEPEKEVFMSAENALGDTYWSFVLGFESKNKSRISRKSEGSPTVGSAAVVVAVTVFSICRILSSLAILVSARKIKSGI
jgi:hypothetical protein